MSELSVRMRGEPIRVRTFSEASEVLTEMHVRLTQVENTTNIVKRVWRFLVWATPAMIAALATGASPDSPAGKLVNWLLASGH